MRCLSGGSETWWDAGGDFSLARKPTPPPPDVKIGMSTLRSLYAMPLLGLTLSCFFRVFYFAMGVVIN